MSNKKIAFHKVLYVNRLKQLIALNDSLTQRTAAQELGISHDTLNKYCKEVCGLYFSDLRKSIIKNLIK
jgi:DNA-binding XRE family transcriptional regulator